VADLNHVHIISKRLQIVCIDTSVKVFIDCIVINYKAILLFRNQDNGSICTGTVISRLGGGDR
jgi:hypothetical protein